MGCIGALAGSPITDVHVTSPGGVRGRACIEGQQGKEGGADALVSSRERVMLRTFTAVTGHPLIRA